MTAENAPKSVKDMMTRVFIWWESSVQPKASIEAVITPAAAIMVAEAFKAGQSVMLEGYGGPWLITRIKTDGGEPGCSVPVTRVWGVIAEDAAQYEWKI